MGVHPCTVFHEFRHKRTARALGATGTAGRAVKWWRKSIKRTDDPAKPKHRDRYLWRSAKPHKYAKITRLHEAVYFFGLSTRMRWRIASSGAHTARRSNSRASSGRVLFCSPGCGQSPAPYSRSGAGLDESLRNLRRFRIVGAARSWYLLRENLPLVMSDCGPADVRVASTTDR